jgi:hypothetical protein
MSFEGDEISAAHVSLSSSRFLDATRESPRSACRINHDQGINLKRLRARFQAHTANSFTFGQQTNRARFLQNLDARRSRARQKARVHFSAAQAESRMVARSEPLAEDIHARAASGIKDCLG